jgi:hypothetical protein
MTGETSELELEPTDTAVELSGLRDVLVELFQHVLVGVAAAEGTHLERRGRPDGLRGLQEFRSVRARFESAMTESAGRASRAGNPAGDRGKLRARNLGMFAVAGQRGPRNPHDQGHFRTLDPVSRRVSATLTCGFSQTEHLIGAPVQRPGSAAGVLACRHKKTPAMNE